MSYYVYSYNAWYIFPQKYSDYHPYFTNNNKTFWNFALSDDLNKSICKKTNCTL